MTGVSEGGWRLVVQLADDPAAARTYRRLRSQLPRDRAIVYPPTVRPGRASGTPSHVEVAVSYRGELPALTQLAALLADADSAELTARSSDGTRTRLLWSDGTFATPTAPSVEARWPAAS